LSKNGFSNVLQLSAEQEARQSTTGQIERVRRFGEVRSFAAGERIMTAGEVAPGLVVVLAGRIALAEHNWRAVRR
jgi:hypothetical protein